MGTLNNLLDKIEEICIVVLLAFMAIMNFANVVARMFAQSFSFTEEITVISFVGVTMLGIAAAYKQYAHMGMSFVVDKLAPENKAKMVLFSTFCSAMFALVLIGYGTAMVNREIALHAFTPSLGLPIQVEGLAIPVGALFIFIRSIQSGLAQYKKVQNSQKEEK